MANAFYAKGAEKVLAPLIGDSAVTGTLKVALMADTYTPDLAADEFWDDISSHVLGTPQALASAVVTGGKLDGDDPVFSAVTGGDTAASLVLFMDTGTPSTSALIAYIDQIGGFPYETTGGDIEPRWDNGIYKILSLT